MQIKCPIFIDSKFWFRRRLMLLYGQILFLFTVKILVIGRITECFPKDKKVLKILLLTTIR
jgi:hypothetical protein